MIVLRSRVSRVDAVAFSPDGSLLAVGGTNGLELWSTFDHTRLWRWEDPSGLRFVQHLHFTSQQALIAVFQLGQFPILFDTFSGRSCELRYAYSDDRVRATAWNPRHEQLVVDSRQRLQCWRFERLESPSPDDFPVRRVVVWTESSSQDHQEICFREVPQEEGFSCEYWILADHTWVVRDAEVGALRRSFRGSSARVDELVDAPRVQFIVGRIKDVLVLWKYHNLKNPLRVIKETKNHYTGMALHPSGVYLAMTSNDHLVRVWDLRRWVDRHPQELKDPQQPVRTYSWRAGRMRSIAFSPDGLFAAAGGELGEFVLFDTEL